MKTRCCLILIVCASAAFAQRSIVVENEWVRIPNVTVQPGHTTGFHVHTMNRVMVYLNEGGQTLEMEAGGKREETWKAGQALWSPAIGRHRVLVSAPKPVTIVEIELRKPVPPSPALTELDPLKVDPKHYKVEMENEQVRVVRVRIPAGETAPMHHQARKRVVVYITDADFEQTTSDGKTVQSRQKAGDVIWSEAEVKHRELNRGGAFEGLVVELK
jgi:quercetin dioxygenase-like cupin family protein